MQNQGGDENMVIVGEAYCDRSKERHLTVRKTSFFFPGDGFAVYEPQRHLNAADESSEGEEVGELVFRVETYGPNNRRAHLILMDPQGRCILTVRRKLPSLHQRWEGFLRRDDQGEEDVHRQPLFSIRRSSIIRRPSCGSGGSFLVEVHPHPAHHYVFRSLVFHVEGSFPRRCCTIYADNGTGSGISNYNAVAEIRRKVDASANMVLGKDVFCLSLRPGFDAAFAMGLVLALDQITTGENEEEGGEEEEKNEYHQQEGGGHRTDADPN